MNEQEYLTETMTIALSKLLLKDNPTLTIQEALDLVYNSNIYDKICDQRSNLAYQNPGYVYCYLKEEIFKEEIG